MYSLGDEAFTRVGLPEGAVFHFSLALGLLLLLFGHKLVYKMLGASSVIVAVVVSVMALGKETMADEKALGVAILAGAVAGWKLIAWYRRQVCHKYDIMV